MRITKIPILPRTRFKFLILAFTLWLGGTVTAEDEHLETAPTEAAATSHGGDHAHGKHHRPTLVAALPFVGILLCIAILPLFHKTEHWWEKNLNKLLISAVLGATVIIYYFTRGSGFLHEGHLTEPGVDTVKAILAHAVLYEYIPFIVLLFSLYTISGGIQLRGDLEATPATNATFLGVGALLASFVGTTGASMLLIHPLLQTNRERKHKRHTVIFFIFLVSNIGGCLLPIGDPPLFLGYLRGVPFLWTLGLWKPWLFCVVLLLIIYIIWDTKLYKQESPRALREDETKIEPLRVKGLLNFVWLFGVVLSVALIVPEKPFLGKYFMVPNFLRELAQLGFVGLAWLTTPAQTREENQFNFYAILEVAVLFIGIFITMQAPIEILKASGKELQQVVSGPGAPMAFFWMTGSLSSFLDNAPTYVVFFEMARSMTQGTVGTIPVTGGHINEVWLVAISLGAVFMGANSYIGNGPNFMVKSIAEQSGVPMPSFFGFMIYSFGILVPVFIVVTIIFL